MELRAENRRGNDCDPQRNKKIKTRISWLAAEQSRKHETRFCRCAVYDCIKQASYLRETTVYRVSRSLSTLFIKDSEADHTGCRCAAKNLGKKATPMWEGIGGLSVSCTDARIFSRKTFLFNLDVKEYYLSPFRPLSFETLETFGSFG